jgi:putative ABC transport system permease protein
VLENRFGIFLDPGGLTGYDVGLLVSIVFAALLMGAVPAWRAYRNTLSDGLTIRV